MNFIFTMLLLVIAILLLQVLEQPSTTAKRNQIAYQPHVSRTGLSTPLRLQPRATKISQGQTTGYCSRVSIRGPAIHIHII